MKTLTSNFVQLSTRFGKDIRVILFVATLVLFVLAAGAPAATGTVGG